MFKDYFLKKRTQKAIKTNRAERFTLNYVDVRKVGLLFLLKSGSEHEILNRFVRRLKAEGKQVEALTLLEGKDGNPYKFNYNFITPEQLTFFGSLKSESVQNFMGTSFDYLYCVNQMDSLIFDYILAGSQAKCRIGQFQEGKSDLFELMLNVKPDAGIKSILETMLYYTKAISHNEYTHV